MTSSEEDHPTRRDFGKVAALAALATAVPRGGCRAMSGGDFDITLFGADPTGISFSDAAIADAVTMAIKNSRGIFIPPGRFKLANQLAYTLPAGALAFCLEGAHSKLSSLYWPEAGGGISGAHQANTQPFSLKNLALLTGAAGGGTAFSVTNASGASNVLDVSDISNVAIKGADGGNLADYWSIGLAATDFSYINSRGLSVVGGSAGGTIAIDLSAPGSEVSAQYIFNFEQANFEVVDTAFLLGDWVQGVNLAHSNIGGRLGISLPAGAPGTVQRDQIQLTIADNQFNMTDAAILANAAFPDILFHDNLILSPSGGNGVILNVAERGSLHDNHYIALGAGTGTAILIGAPGYGGLSGIVHDELIEAYAVGVDQTLAVPPWMDPATANMRYIGCTANTKR